MCSPQASRERVRYIPRTKVIRRKKRADWWRWRWGTWMTEVDVELTFNSKFEAINNKEKSKKE